MKKNKVIRNFLRKKVIKKCWSAKNFSPQTRRQVSATAFIIHYEDLYSASSRLLLRSAPNPCTCKRNSFLAGVECVGKNP